MKDMKCTKDTNVLQMTIEGKKNITNITTMAAKEEAEEIIVDVEEITLIPS